MKIHPTGRNILGRVRPKDEKEGSLFLPPNRVTNRWCENEPLKVDVLAKGPRVGPDIYVGQCLLVDVVAEEKFGVLPDGLILFPEDYYKAGKDLADFAKGYRGVIHCEIVD